MKRVIWVILGLGATVFLALALRMNMQPARVTRGPKGKDNLLIAFEDLQFQEPIVRERLEKAEAVVNTIASPKWQHVPWHWQGATGHVPDTHFIFSTAWCFPPTGKPYCSCERDTNPCRLINLTASPRDSKVGAPKQIHYWSLHVNDYPADEGWGVSLSYSENWLQGVQVQEHFRTWLFRTRWSRDEAFNITLKLPSSDFELRHKFDSVEYVFTISLEKLEPRYHQAREYLSSPAQLRNTILEAQDVLQTRLSEQIEAGLPTMVLDHALMVSSPPTRNPPEWGPPRPTAFEPPIPEKYALTPEQKQQLIQLMVAGLDERRELARESADEIHEAIESAFPLGALLNGFDANQVAAQKHNGKLRD